MGLRVGSDRETTCRSPLTPMNDASGPVKGLTAIGQWQATCRRPELLPARLLEA